ncbi:MAG: hypothetical protein CBR30_00340 [Dictyoglomus sp. NZ13-RE01]|nr:MAG: hypothetical protein CBR30_00340 [Dictyoglomus sp. NZ13-RE01]
MRGMTASCFKEISFGSLKLYMEFKGYNHRFLELKIYLPQNLTYLEKEFIDKIRSNIKRGQVIFNLRMYNNIESIPKLNSSFIEESLKEIEKITGKKEILSDWKELLINPQAFTLEPKSFSNEEVDFIKKEFDLLLENFLEEKRKEGEGISKSLEKCIQIIKENLEKIEAEDENWKKEVHEILNKKLEEWNITIERDRLIQEIALIIMKADINEELERLKIFIAKFEEEMKRDDSIGKTLDFIIQEMWREINTLSSKTAKTKIMEYSLKIKEELEKMRELINNVE